MNANGPGTPLAADSAVAPGILTELAGTRPWIQLATIVIAAFVVLTAVNVGMMTWGEYGVAVGAVAVISNAMAVVFYVALGVLLHRYAVAIGQATVTGTAADIEVALDRQRLFWKVVGILTLIGLVGGLVLGIGAAVFGVMSQL